MYIYIYIHMLHVQTYSQPHESSIYIYLAIYLPIFLLPCLSIYLSICLSACLSINAFLLVFLKHLPTCLSNYPPIVISMCMYLPISTSPSLHRPSYLPIYRSIHLSIYVFYPSVSVSPSLYLSHFFLYIPLSLYLSCYLFIHLSIYQMHAYCVHWEFFSLGGGCVHQDLAYPREARKKDLHERVWARLVFRR